MKNVILALFVLWFLSLHYYVQVPLLLSMLLGAALVSVTSVAVAQWLARPAAVNRGGSLGL